MNQENENMHGIHKNIEDLFVDTKNTGELKETICKESPNEAKLMEFSDLKISASKKQLQRLSFLGCQLSNFCGMQKLCCPVKKLFREGTDRENLN